MILYDYKSFLNEAKNKDNDIPLYLSERFYQTLYRIKDDDKIIMKLISVAVNPPRMKFPKKVMLFDVSFIDITDKDDTISYITSTKAKPVLDKESLLGHPQDGFNFCWVNNRQDQKLTRFINRIFPNEFTQKEVTDFVDHYKAAFKGDDHLKDFEVVKGLDIKKYYYVENSNQEAAGQLQRSCMRARDRQKFFGILIENPDKVNMLILKDSEGNIYGRANLWYLDDPSGRVYMDRIYTTYDWQIKLFIDYAIKNNFIYKSKQIYGGSVIPVIDGGRKHKLTMTVNLKPKDYDYYPYLDTLQFYNPKTGVLTSDVKKFRDKSFVTLVTATGQYYVDDGDTFRIDHLGRIVHEGNLRWSELDQVYVHRQYAIQLRYRNDFVSPDHDFVEIGGDIYLKDDMETDGHGGLKLKKEFLN